MIFKHTSGARVKLISFDGVKYRFLVLTGSKKGLEFAKGCLDGLKPIVRVA